MKRLSHTILFLVITIVLAISFTSCTSTSELLPLLNNSAKAEASADDYEAMSSKISQLESRIEQLEQGLDERVIEYNIVKSALIQMVLDNDLIDADWGNVSLGTYSSSWAPTNDMRLFPSPDSPVFGYDKNKDGKSDTNYVPFETSKWFYGYFDDLQIEQFPDMGWSHLTKRPTLEELNQSAQIHTYTSELHNLQTAVMAMLADSRAGMLDATLTSIDDMDLVTSDSGALVLSHYLAGLNADGTLKSGCRYDFAMDGTVTQKLPIAPITNPQDYEEELHNIQTAVMAMLADSSSSIITAGTGVATNDMDNITTDGGTIVLSNYLTGLSPDGTVKSGCIYVFAVDGTVTQIIP